jgi:hypothetical protein
MERSVTILEVVMTAARRRQTHSGRNEGASLRLRPRCNIRADGKYHMFGEALAKGGTFSVIVRQS